MDLKKLIETLDHIEEKKQIPGDQVRGTEKAKTDGKKHPFLHRLVGDAKELKKQEQEKEVVFGEEEDLKETLKREFNQFILEQYPKRPGLEGPHQMRNGKIIYYDSAKDQYIDADSKVLDEYGPVGAEAPITPPAQQQPMQMNNPASAGTVANTAPTGNNIQQPVQQNAQQQNAQQQGQQQNTAQTQQQPQQAALTPSQQGNKQPMVGPQDIAMGFLKGMGVQNPQKPAIDALAKSLGKNLKVAK